MNSKGLIIEDNKKFAGDVKCLLSTIDHECDIAYDFSEAKSLIDQGGYDYYLVDLEIPAQPGAPAEIQNGEQAISRILSRVGPLGPPVIVVTGHGHGTYELATRTMKLGASDYVTKPLAGSLCETVKANLQRRAQMTRNVRKQIFESDKQSERSFQGGDLVFHDEYVSLCGVRITEDNGFGYAITVLETLCETNSKGCYQSFTAEDVARRIDSIADGGTATRCIYRLRGNITTRLKESLSILAGPESVISHHPRHGYQLANCVTVINERSGAMDSLPTCGLTNRQRWIIEQLTLGHRLKRAHLEGKFNVSERTAKRDFRALVNQGHIEFFREARPGFYRLARSSTASRQ